jgi:flagellar biosynthesis/type III secretory pathway M-ring protein FliF/YscJ
MMQGDEIQLHDIKPIIDIQEYSLYYFLGLVGLVLLLVGGILYLVVLWFKRRNAFNIRKEHKKLLSSLDLSEPKKSAYAMTYYGATFKNDSPRHEQMYNNLISKLEDYKYKKTVERLDEETIGYFELYKEMCDV